MKTTTLTMRKKTLRMKAMTLKFSDGVSFDTSGKLRITRRHDGLYVVGRGMLIPINDREEGQKILDEESAKAEKSENLRQ